MTMACERILLVEDDPALLEALSDTLMLEGYDCEAVVDAASALNCLSQTAFSLVLSDINMPGMDGHAFQKTVREHYPGLPVVLMTAFASVGRAVEAIKEGAADYLVKPFEPQVLLSTIKRHALSVRESVEDPIAQDPSSLKLLSLAAKVARSDSSVLICGESGTGKEVLARYIHAQSPRRSKPFVAINCAAIPDNMLEAMLFGYEKGAFTGATAAHPGKFELANGGTLLLDEITEMPLGLQAKLLRVLQEREVERLGARSPVTLDIRVLATTNRDLALEVSAGRFREDLYYRLSVFPLTWKSLRDRPEDIIPLARHLLAMHAHKMQLSHVHFSESALRCLRSYSWPGNVRELDNAVQRALILQQAGVVEAEDLCLDGVFEAPQMVAVEKESLTDAGLGVDVKRHEQQMILEALKLERGRRKEAAERLGISPRTLRYKLAQMREAGLDIEAQVFAS